MKLTSALLSMAFASSAKGFSLGVVRQVAASRHVAMPTTAATTGAFAAATQSSTALRMASAEASATPLDFVKSEIESHKVVVFSKSYCPFCTRTKSLLSDMDIDYQLYELDNMDNGNDIQAALLEVSGQRTVPNVFVNGQHLGGNDDTQDAARTGKLQEMIGA